MTRAIGDEAPTPNVGAHEGDPDADANPKPTTRLLRFGCRVLRLRGCRRVGDAVGHRARLEGGLDEGVELFGGDLLEPVGQTGVEVQPGVAQRTQVLSKRDVASRFDTAAIVVPVSDPGHE